MASGSCARSSSFIPPHLQAAEEPMWGWVAAAGGAGAGGCLGENGGSWVPGPPWCTVMLPPVPSGVSPALCRAPLLWAFADVHPDLLPRGW